VVQNNHSSTAHSAVPAYYEGTADLSAESNGDHIPILAGWYGNTPDKPPRTATGYYYSHIVRGTPPNTGVGNNFGGVGARTNLSVNGAQAPDKVAQELDMMISDAAAARA